MSDFGYEPFRAASEQLGLRLIEGKGLLKEGQYALEGSIDGQRVSIRMWRGDWVWVEIEVFFDPPLDLHLHIARAGVLSTIGALFGKHDIEVGEREFDGAFDIKAHEPARAAALLTADVQRALLLWKEAGELFGVDDEGVHVSIRTGSFYSEPEASRIVNDARAAAHLARTITTAIPNVPPSPILAKHVDAWRAFASERSLEFHATPLHVSGLLAREAIRGDAPVPFSARVVPIAKDRYGVELRVRIDPKPACYLRVRPAHWYDFAEPTGEARHTATGDAAFDSALRVTTNDPDAARRLLGDRARALLLALQAEHAGVSVKDGEVAVRTKTMIDPEAFADVVERVAAVGREIRA